MTLGVDFNSGQEVIGSPGSREEEHGSTRGRGRGTLYWLRFTGEEDTRGDTQVIYNKKEKNLIFFLI